MHVWKATWSILNDEYVVASDIADSIADTLYPFVSRILWILVKCNNLKNFLTVHAYVVSFYTLLEYVLYFCIEILRILHIFYYSKIYFFLVIIFLSNRAYWLLNFYSVVFLLYFSSILSFVPTKSGYVMYWIADKLFNPRYTIATLNYY